MSLKKKRISPSDPKSVQASSKIQSTNIQSPKEISFSYRYFKNDNEKFSISNKDARYLEALIERLRDLSTMTFNEITVINAKRLRCHAIDWTDTTEVCFGLPNEKQLVDTPYQFQLSSNEHGRVHGFFLKNVFYIVWLDPNHNLYS